MSRRVAPVQHDASLLATSRRVVPDVGDDASCLAAVQHDASRLAAAQDDASGRTCATGRVCAWCSGPIPPTARRDAVCCSTRCRQARHRFTRGVGPAAALAADRPLRLAYADPPYPGNAYLYRGHPDYGGEVDHAALLEQLQGFDGWALSTSASALPAVLALCPPGVRVGAWVRGERPTRSARPLNAWEPVIYSGGRAVAAGSSATRRGDQVATRREGLGTTRRTDALVYAARARTTDPGRVIGAKPAAFARWVFDLLGALPGDDFVDVFPGSGGVARAWDVYAATPLP